MKALNKLWSEMTKPQQELASQEVKLSAVERLEDIIDSMRSAKDEIETAVSDFDQYMDRAYGAYVDMKEASDNANYGMNELDEAIDDVAKAAEQLGIDVPAVKEGRRVMQDVESAYADAEERIRKFNL
jgi:methyl-accepting chemotaxis protein